MRSKVIVAPATEVVTLAEVKANARVEHTEEDALIAHYLTAAREYTENLIGRAIGEQTLRIQFDAFPDGAIRLDMPPVVSIASVTYIDPDGAQLTVDPSEYALDDGAEMNWLLPASAWPATKDIANAVRIDYVAGYTPADCPAVVKQFIMMSAASMYATRETDAEKATVPVYFTRRLLDRYRIVEL
jgi:uncharacterized phiE125 gp8 family phage protein